MADGVVLTVAGFNKLKRELEQLALSYKNLSRRIQHYDKKRIARGMFLRMMIGKTDASHAKGASGVVSIWQGEAGNETDSGRNITAYNRFAAVGSGKWVMVAVVRGRAYLIAAECP